MNIFPMIGAASVGALIATFGHIFINFDFSALSLLGA
jgi:hypothetical protein